jgi:hypothetical protein
MEMSKFYNPRRSRNIFDPDRKEPYALSRSKLDLFFKCPRCFYLDRRLGVSQPPGYPFTLNSAVDKLLKKEFDVHRAAKTTHPLMKTYGLDLIPYHHEKMKEWTDALSGGIRYWHQPTNLLITGGIDDIWTDGAGTIFVVDYKATAKDAEINLDAQWQEGYKRQVEIYQWLFRRNDFRVGNTAYFVYCNGITDKAAFDGKLEFDVKIIPYDGNDHWVEQAINDAHKCLSADSLPPCADDCDFCAYRNAVRAVE